MGEPPSRIALLGVLVLALSGCAGERPASPASTVSEQSGVEASPTAQVTSASSPDGDDLAAVTSTAPAVTTEVAAPDGGDISVSVDVEEQEILPEVPFAETVEVDGHIEVEINKVSTVEAEARGPGEIGGSAIQVDIHLSNGSKKTIDLGQVTVGAEDGQVTPLSPLSAEPADPFFGELAAGEAADAIYIFSFPTDSSLPVTITVNPAPEAPVAVFVGDPS